eukprot:40523-Rhodomonas_salina.1
MAKIRTPGAMSTRASRAVADAQAPSSETAEQKTAKDAAVRQGDTQQMEGVKSGNNPQTLTAVHT